MYIEQNFVDPAVLDLQANRRMKNRILKYWPRTPVDGVEIFGRLYLYNGSVQKSAMHLKLYNLLGVQVGDLESESWQGIETYYLYFKVVQGLEEDLTAVDLERAVIEAMPFTEKSVDTVEEEDRSEWITVPISYEPLHVETQNSALSNAQIIAAIRSNPQVATYDSISSNIMAVVALLDTTDSLFEKTFTVDNVQLTDVSHLVNTIKTSKINRTKVVKEAGLTMRFRRKLVDDTIQDSVLGAVTTYINAITTAVTDLDIQAKRLYRTLVPFTDDDIILAQPASIGILTNLHNNIGGSLVGYKVAGLANVPSKTFNKAIVGQITSGYTEESVSWWKKLITVIVAIVIVVVAIWAAIPTGGGSLGWAATILTVGSLAMQGLAIVLAKSDPAWGAYIGKAATVLGYIATAVGIINIVGQLAKSVAAEAGKEAAKEAGKEVVADTVKEIGKETAKEMTMQEAATIIKGLSFDELSDALVAAMKQSFSTSTSMNMTNVLSWATKGFQIYIKYITPPDKGIDELQEQVDAQEKVREDLTGPGLKDKIDYAFSSPLYGIYECNEIMQGIPHSMTQGKIDICFNKYYDGTTSKVKYRGYLG
jgi:hypothetical protein